MANGDDKKTQKRGGAFQPSGNTSGKTMMITPIKVPSIPATELSSAGEVAVRDLRGAVLDGRYVLQDRVNGGNMGEIWRAKDKKLWNMAGHWLVKILPPVFAGAKAYVEALEREAQITSGLSGDHFPMIVDVGVTDGIAFMVMQGLPGETLSAYLEEQHPTGMPAKEAVVILCRILEGLAIAHKEGVIHRDIKPDNLLIEHEEGKPPKVRILDFGVAKTQSEVFATLSKTLPNGTQQYRPPEGHMLGPADATAGGDVFAVGLTAYQMILGRHPFAGGDYVARYERAEALCVLHEDVEGISAGVDSAFGSVLSKAVAFDPAKRYRDATEMLEALEFATTFRAEAIPKGAIIDRSYRVLGSLGAGGMGAVYKVEDTHRMKAEKLLLKVLVCPPGAPEEHQNSFRERFRRECESLYTVTHDAIPRIFSNGSHEGVPYLVMAQAKGHALSRCFDALLAKGGWEAVFHMARGIASALDTIHARGLIHRDIKPPNIVVDPDTGNAMVIDFGIVRVDDTALTADDTFIGTPGYAAPEQMSGDTVKESDQWSFGACFYYLLSGIHPGEMPGENTTGAGKSSPLERIAYGDYPTLAELDLRFPVPESIVSAVVKAMSLEPTDRFASVADFARAMELGVTETQTPIHVQRALSSDASMVGTTQPERPMAQALPPQGLTGSTVATTEVVARSPQRGPYAVLMALVALVAVAGGTYALTRGDAPSNSVAAAPVSTEFAGGGVGQPQGPAPALVPPVPTAASDAAPAVEVTSVDAPVVTSIDGQLVEGLALRIGDSVLASSESLTLPLGEVEVHVGVGDYKGVYTCVMTPASESCDIALERAVATKRRRPRHKPKIDDGEEDMINFREDSDKKTP